jgi:maltooligosyltrehalose trehalohydrolase
MLLFSAPALPLLFQGEEYAEEAPFDYFTSHGDPALATAVREGRHAEYLHLLEEGADMAAWADPQAERTFRNCKLRWTSLEDAPHADMLAFYRALIAARRRLAPLQDGRKDFTRVEGDEAGRWLTILRRDAAGGATFTCANLGDVAARLRFPHGTWRLTLATDGAPAEAAQGQPFTLAPSTAALYERVGG